MMIINPDAIGMDVLPATPNILTITNLGAGTPVDFDFILIGVRAT